MCLIRMPARFQGIFGAVPAPFHNTLLLHFILTMAIHIFISPGVITSLCIPAPSILLTVFFSRSLFSIHGPNQGDLTSYPEPYHNQSMVYATANTAFFNTLCYVQFMNAG